MLALWDQPSSKHVRRVVLHDHWWGMGNPQTRNLDLEIDLVEGGNTGLVTVHMDYPQTDAIKDTEFPFNTDGDAIRQLIHKVLMVPVDELAMPLGRGSRQTDSYFSRSIELYFGNPDGSDNQLMKLVADPWEPDLAPWTVSIDGAKRGYLNSGIVLTSWDAIWARTPRYKLRDLEECDLSKEQRLHRAYDRTTFSVRFRDGDARIRPGESPGPLMEAGIRARNASTMAIVTACNPNSTSLAGEIENEREQRRLGIELKRRGFPHYLEARGEPSELDNDWKPEPSFAVFDIALKDAMEIGRAFGQRAIVFVALGDVVRVIDCQEGSDLSEFASLNSPSPDTSTPFRPQGSAHGAAPTATTGSRETPQDNISVASETAEPLEQIKGFLRDAFALRHAQELPNGFSIVNGSFETHVFSSPPDDPAEADGQVEAVIQVVTMLPKHLADIIGGRSGVLNRMATLGALTDTTDGWAVLSRLTTFKNENAWRIYVPLLAASAYWGASTLLGAASKSLKQEPVVPNVESEWIASDFDDLVELHASRWPCSSGGLGMSIEYPLSGDSRAAFEGNTRTALLRLSADEPHPMLGGGLLCRLEMPHRIHDSKRRDQVLRELNELEASAIDLPPHAGAWCEGAMDANPCYVMFVPNAMRYLHLHQNIIFWFAWRAQFANAALHARGIAVE